MTGVLLVALAALGTRAAPAAQAVALDFDDLQRLVRERNLEVAGAERVVAAAGARTGYLRRSYLPVVAGGAGAERFRTGGYGARSEPYGSAEARLNLFRGGRDALEEGVLESRRVAAQAASEATLSAELLQARRTYWTLVGLRETLGVLAQGVERTEENLQAAEKRIKAGLAGETDRLEFQIHRSQLKEELESVSHETVLVQISLAALLGLPVETRFATTESIPHVHDEALLSESYEPGAHPEVRSLRAAQASAAGQRRQSERWWTPSVELYGGHALYTLRERDYLDRSLRDDSYAGARLSLALFDGLASRRESLAQARQAEGYGKQAEQRSLAVRARVERAKEEMKHLHELIHNGEERLEQGKRYLASVFDEYRRGVKNSIDVLGASQRYLGFQRQYVERRRDYQSAKAELQAILGR